MKMVKHRQKNKKETQVTFCIICGGYCTHEHHLVSPKDNGNHSFKNKVNICWICHWKLNKGLLKIKASKLPAGAVNYIKSKKIANDAIDWES